MGFYGNMWINKSLPTEFDNIILSIESDLVLFNDLYIVNESFITEAVSIKNVIDKIKEYWIKLKKWFKEKIKFFINKIKEYLKNNSNFGKDIKFDKSKNKNYAKFNIEEKTSIEGMYYNDVKIGMSFLSYIISDLRRALITTKSDLSGGFYNKEEIDNKYNDFKEKIDEALASTIVSSECKEFQYDIRKTDRVDDFCRKIENVMHRIIDSSEKITSIIKDVNEQYVDCDKAIDEFDKFIIKTIDEIKRREGDAETFGTLNYYKNKVKQNNKYVEDNDEKLRNILNNYINKNNRFEFSASNTINYFEKAIGHKIESKKDVEEALEYNKNHRTSYEKLMIDSSDEKSKIRYINDDISILYVELKMIKDALQATKDVGLKAVSYTQDLFRYAQHNKIEYNKLLSIYNDIK